MSPELREVVKSWTLDENRDWQPPVAMPTEGGPYMWDEDTLTWLAVTAG